MKGRVIAPLPIPIPPLEFNLTICQSELKIIRMALVMMIDSGSVFQNIGSLYEQFRNLEDDGDTEITE
tara:strand:- start:421 stop:624 length:204 start_codon:yes stop_codon:yes gene_type:complete